MTGSNRIKGAALGLTIDGVDYWADVTSVVFDNEEASGDVTTFADAAAGGARQHFASISAIQSVETASFWRYVWANTGAEAAYKYAPHGNAVASADQPHLIGTLKIGPKPSLGGEAGASNTFTFDTRFDINGEPTLDLGASGTPVITSISPTGAEIGELVVIAGTRFTGVTGVTFDGDPVEFIFNSDSSISAVVDGVGAVPVVVTTGEGASAAFTYTVAA
jgi:hypothetical protein